MGACRQYGRAVGWLVVAAIFLSLALMQASKNGVDVWLAIWVDRIQNMGNSTSTLTTTPATSLSAPHSVPLASLYKAQLATGVPGDGIQNLRGTSGWGSSQSGMGYSTVQYYSTIQDYSTAQDGSDSDRRGGSVTVLGQDRDATNRWFLGVFALIALANSVFTLARAFSFAYGGLRAAHVLHGQLIQAVSHASMTFFDHNPTGRLLNR